MGMKLTKRQKNVLIGTILGDGCLELNGSKVRLRIDHSKKQREYVEWKHSIFSNVAANEPRSVQVFDKRTRKVYQHWRFDTLSIDLLVKYRRMFYRNGRKIIPKNIQRLLNSNLSLAVWFMDDGYNRKDCRGLHINTQGYCLEEQKGLQKCLLDNFNLGVNIHKQTGKYKLYVPSKEREKFNKLIAQYILPSMKRKLF